MNLDIEIRKAGIEWAIDKVFAQKESTDRPGEFHQVMRTRLRFADWKAEGLKTGETPPTLERLYTWTPEDMTIQKLLAIGLRDLLPDHPIRRAFLDSVGNAPVVIPEGRLNDNLGEIIHVQLRKSVDSKQSTIQWNAVHHMLPDDWSHVLQLIREAVAEAVQGAAQARKGQGRPLLRRDVGMAIKHAMTEKMSDVAHRGFEKTNRLPTRTPFQKFALMSFESANWLTEDSDWTFGWTAYLCDSIEVSNSDAGATAETLNA